MSAIPRPRIQDEIAARIYRAWEARREREGLRTYLGMSSIGAPCDRALWYRFRQFTPIPPEGRMIALWDLGNHVEAQIVEGLRMAGLNVIGQQEGFSAHGGLFRGHCDGMVEGITQRVHILECKSANANKFKAFKDNGVRKVAPVYYCQVQCYMGYGLLERALFVIVNKNNSEIYTERIYFDRADFEALHWRAHAIITANHPPEKVAIDCDWCDFRLHCAEAGSLQRHRTCGTCKQCYFEGLTPKCEKHGTNVIWGRGCENWSFSPSGYDGVPF